MKTRYLIIPVLLLFASCATYKQLKPVPPVSPAEQGFMTLKKKDKQFRLKREKKYFVSFPAPAEKNFYLVLDVPAKQLGSFLTSELVKKKTYGEKIKDESANPDKLSVYAIHEGVAQYYWLMETVKTETELALQYRYVPQWRFKFENHHAAFKATLDKNKVDRTVYTTLGKTFHFQNYNFINELASVDKHRGEIDQVHKELLAIESIFPQSILNSQDQAYQDYLTLKKEVEGEISFLTNYRTVLDFFYKEDRTLGKVPEFLALLPDFTGYFKGKDRLPPDIVQESQKVIKKRLETLAPFYNGLLSVKTGWVPLDDATYHVHALPQVDTLCLNAGIAAPPDFIALSRYVDDFNRKAELLVDVLQDQENAKKRQAELAQMPGNDFYPGLAAKLSKALDMMPHLMGTEFGFYSNFQATKSLNSEIKNTKTVLGKLLQQYRQAGDLVAQLNGLKAKKAYRQMISVLKQHSQLGFLLAKYHALDKMSVDKQVGDVKTALKKHNWWAAEAVLNKLHQDKTFLNPAAIKQQKRKTVLQLEDALYTGIDKVSREKILKFVEEKVHELDDVDGLYADSVFLPAHDVRFSSGSQLHLVKRKNELVAHLAKMKENEFPAKAIALLYDEFMKNPADNGVLKCRAVVAHGRHYQGKEKKLKIRIAECDPYSAKRVYKIKEYRRVFALPTTDKPKGTNRYFFRLNLDVPSEAKFPVWDVTIKLPKVIAKSAGTEQWYQKISLNKKLLKNEGRFSIGAPTPENNYECKITPVQTRKGKSNILDVFFKHPSFKAYPVSIMVQKPIIKKN